MSVKIRKDIPASELYKCAKGEKNSRVRSRMLAIAAVLEDHSRAYAAQLAGLTPTNFRVWVRRFNEQGIQGLRGKNYQGRKSSWPPGAEQFLQEKALEGALFEKNKRVAYRLKDFQTLIKEKFGVRYAESTIWEALQRLDLSWLSVRQKHPKTDEAAQEEFKKKALT